MPEPSPLNPVIQLAASRFLAKPLHVVARLGIADLLASGPQTVDRLAASTKTHAPSLYRVMRSLSGIGVFRESADRTFELTPVSQALRAGEGSLRPMVLWLQDPSVDHIWENFLWSVQTGRPAVEKTHGMEAFRWLSTDAEVAAVFNDAMSSNAAVRYAAVLDAYDFSGIQRLVDVGGGHGALMERVLRKVPSVTGVVFDLPAVVAGTSRRLREAGLADRCETMSGDIFSDVPHADAHMMSSVLHDWDDERCVTIVRNCHRASVPGGKLIVLEMVVGGANEPSFAKMLDMQMLALTGGRERTADEFAVIFREGGYRLARVVRTAGPVSVIEGIRE